MAKIQQLPQITLNNAAGSNVVKLTASNKGALTGIDAKKVIDVVNLSDDEDQSPKPIASTSSVPTIEHHPTDEKGVQRGSVSNKCLEISPFDFWCKASPFKSPYL